MNLPLDLSKIQTIEDVRNQCNGSVESIQDFMRFVYNTSSSSFLEKPEKPKLPKEITSKSTSKEVKEYSENLLRYQEELLIWEPLYNEYLNKKTIRQDEINRVLRLAINFIKDEAGLTAFSKEIQTKAWEFANEYGDEDDYLRTYYLVQELVVILNLVKKECVL